MPAQLQAILDQALRLSDAKRAELVRELLESFEPPAAVRAAWTKELRKRLADIRAGRGATLDAEVALADLRATRAQGTRRRQ